MPDLRQREAAPSPGPFLGSVILHGQPVRHLHKSVQAEDDVDRGLRDDVKQVVHVP